MNIGTSRSGEVVTGRGVETTEGLGAGAGGLGLGRADELVRAADGVDGADGVVIDDKGLGVDDVVNADGGDAVDGSDVGTVDPPALAPRRAPAQPATTIESTAAPARERAAYRRGRLTTRHAIEPISAERSAFDMMAS